jgi:hypothetical protein
VKYGDLPSLLALGAPRGLWLAGETPESVDLATAAYRAVGVPDGPSFDEGPAEGRAARAVAWLLE